MAKQEVTYQDILQQLQLRQFSPIYLLMGEEPYYLDKLTDYFESNILSEDEKLMNQVVYYGKDAQVETIINEAMQFPLMSPYRLVILKEAQTLDNKNKLDLLEHYLKQPAPSTILVITYKYGTIDRRKKWIQQAEKFGVVLDSKKLRDYQVTTFIVSLAKSVKLSIDEEAVAMLIEFIGTDLTQLESVINKFDILLITNRRVTTEIIEKTIGISKDYTAFELVNALIAKDVVRSNRIIMHTTSAIQQIISILFNYFSGLMIYHYLQNKSKDNVVAQLRINPYFVKDYELGARNFSKMKTFKTIGYLREYDAKSKGVNNTSANDLDLLKELIYKILH